MQQINRPTARPEPGKTGPHAQLGDCLRASFACPDRECPETRELLLRLFDVPAPGERRGKT